MPVQQIEEPMTYEQFVENYEDDYLYRVEQDLSDWMAEAIFTIVRNEQKNAEELFAEMYPQQLVEFLTHLEYAEHADLLREYIQKENLQIRSHALSMISSMLKMAARMDARMAHSG
jgi:Mg/Co/Ni transporter MgtE